MKWRTRFRRKAWKTSPNGCGRLWIEHRRRHSSTEWLFRRALFREEKLERRLDALGPGAFVVLAAAHFLEFQISIQAPALRDENVAQIADIAGSELAFFRADV